MNVGRHHHVTTMALLMREGNIRIAIGTLSRVSASHIATEAYQITKQPLA